MEAVTIQFLTPVIGCPMCILMADLDPR